MRIAIMGANGHLGLKLIRAIHDQQPEAEVVALVRSERAAMQIRAISPEVSISIVDYTRAQDIAEAAAACDKIVHLVGIIKESAKNTFYDAHEAPCEAMTEALSMPLMIAKQVIYLGISGTDAASSNACLRSRANAEAILQTGDTPVTVIRVPMVLGPDDYASFALRRQATSKIVFTFRAASLEQPIYCGDVIAAIMASLISPPVNLVIELAGLESLSRRDLIKRAGRLFSKDPLVISLPISIGMGLAGLFESLSKTPPVTRAMLGVLDHDDQVDVSAGASALGLKLTGLDETLRLVLTEIEG